MTVTHQREQLRSMTVSALMAAVLCILSPWTLNIGPIPLSLCTLLIYLFAYLLPWRWAVGATGLYLLLGMAGLSVFSGFSGGLGKLAGPTGGYLVGYLLLALLSAGFRERFPEDRRYQLLGMLLGTAVLYALGTAWFCIQSGSTLQGALLLCVVPFLPGDALKMLLALSLGPLLRRRLTENHVI